MFVEIKPDDVEPKRKKFILETCQALEALLNERTEKFNEEFGIGRKAAPLCSFFMTCTGAFSANVLCNILRNIGAENELEVMGEYFEMVAELVKRVLKENQS